MILFQINLEVKCIALVGDMGKFAEDGEIECLGRADAQVKIRGYRIETGEIEYQLLSVKPALRRAVVIAIADKSGINKLGCLYSC